MLPPSTSAVQHVSHLCTHLPFSLCSNEGDSVATFPIADYYHVGMQVRLYKTDDEPVVTYPSKTETWRGTFSRLWA
jgi:hypothetical protein